jgi:phosphatidylserine/phosphatidylglycerophosphate/cardiolipin synthase-like enzyme
MTTAEACLKLVEELPGSLVESLIVQLRVGAAPAMPNPGYQGRVDEFLRCQADVRGELAPMLEVALAAKRSRQTAELVWTGPSTPVVPARGTEQVLCDLIRNAERRLTMTSFGIFQVPRLVEELEQSLGRGVALRIVLGDREWHSDQEIDRQRHQLGRAVATRAALLQWPAERRPRDEHGYAGLMHVKAAVADSRIAFLTSANLTEAALERNMELGVLIRGGNLPAAIDRLIDALLESGELQVVAGGVVR